MENNLKEEFNVCLETKRQQDMIVNALSLSDKVLQVLRGAMPQEDSECLSDNCVLDTMKINTRNLKDLEKNLDEIVRKIVG